MGGVPEGHSGWTFLTNHARVLASIADDPGTRIRDIAARCRLTERAVQKIISDLEQNGYLTHTRQGRSNLYRIEEGTILRHPADAGLTVAGLLAALGEHENSHETRPGQGAGHQGSDETEEPADDDTMTATRSVRVGRHRVKS
ncbi:MarR family transcriptional regulator [Streptomyces sp. RLB3-17]|uniref:helix-turn-helix transcriptional regulator n=1 Tax=unclassified Streptomyces TaxID=2593676 RepID=UPI0011656D90|nr:MULTISPECIES: helix-turn-helix domain-containing protein [unclassified Streptomyces]NMI55691.1 MarR family transcriptional regulator [Streptomyces sp. RLA2-12]QDN55182.1 MarR family transcriptional regulator [Streptomyces sp. S1D4-20]QDN65361.1 MarR family transcriptional regulator [Streptomyces sp. S1D4-14]QDO03907.1 MarR family transcriptional regulator [Streptomyces sp. RLB1-9]QDO25638.1 MarR family transcriptional regulator [Streptomyces sp. S1A1-8]